MTIYSFRYIEAENGKKSALERDYLIDALQALVTVALWLRLDWLLLSAWSDVRAGLVVWAKAALSVLLCWVVVGWLWIVWKLDR